MTTVTIVVDVIQTPSINVKINQIQLHVIMAPIQDRHRKLPIIIRIYRATTTMKAHRSKNHSRNRINMGNAMESAIVICTQMKTPNRLLDRIVHHFNTIQLIRTINMWFNNTKVVNIFC